MKNLFFYKVLCWCAGAIVVITFVSGCATILNFQVSVPHEVPAGAKGKINSEIIQLNVDELSIALQLQNFQIQSGGAARPLGLWLEIGSTMGSLTLDPRQVTLIANGSSGRKVLTFLGPSDAWQSPRAVAQGCGPRRYSMGWSISKVDVSIDEVLRGSPNRGIRNPEVGPVPFEGKRCFLFWFDTDPSPSLPFIVSIRGVTRDGTPVVIPDVHFVPGTVRKMVIP